MTPYRILVTGSRNWRRIRLLAELMDEIGGRADGRQVVVVHGAARGADSHVSYYAWLRAWECEPHPVTRAQWKAGKWVGHARNQHMVNLGADACLAFIRDHSRGATNCANLAEEAGIEVIRRFDCECHDVLGN